MKKQDTYLDENWLNKISATKFELVKIDHFASLYYLISRVVYAKLTAMEGIEPAYDHSINKMRNNFALILARIFRVYGCGLRDIISRWVRQALKGQRLEVYNKENIFDYIYAEDVADGLIKISENIDTNDIVNLGSGILRKVESPLKIITSLIPGLKLKEIKQEGHF